MDLLNMLYLLNHCLPLNENDDETVRLLSRARYPQLSQEFKKWSQPFLPFSSLVNTYLAGVTQTTRPTLPQGFSLTKVKVFLSSCCRTGEARSAVCVRETSGHKNNKQGKVDRICITKGKWHEFHIALFFFFPFYYSLWCLFRGRCLSSLVAALSL